jgi:hypothetical protein
VRVLEVGGDPDLAEEALVAEHGGELGMQDLEGDGAVVLQVARQEDGGHAAAAELAVEAVAVGQVGLESGEQVGQGGRWWGKGQKCAGAGRLASRALSPSPKGHRAQVAPIELSLLSRRGKPGAMVVRRLAVSPGFALVNDGSREFG